MAFGLLFSPAGSAGACRGSCPPWGAPAAVQARRRAGVWIVHAGIPLSSVLAHGQEQDLPGSLAIHPVTLRRSTTPDDPLRLANIGAFGTAPGQLTPKASSFYRFRGLPRRFITCCLRFTTGVAARHARLASGWRAAPLPGGSRTRWTATRGFSSCHPPLQGLPWRNNCTARALSGRRGMWWLCSMSLFIRSPREARKAGRRVMSPTGSLQIPNRVVVSLDPELRKV